MSQILFHNNVIYTFNPVSFMFEHETQPPLSFEDGQKITQSYQEVRQAWMDYFNMGHTRYVHVIERHRTSSISVLLTPEHIAHGMVLLRTIVANSDGIIQHRDESFMSLLDPRCPDIHQINISSSSMSW